MRSKFSAKVTQELVNLLFAEFEIWEKLNDGRLTIEAIPQKVVPSKNYPSCVSQILQHRLPNGKHIATTHRIFNTAEKTAPHWDACDFHLGDVVLYR